MNRRWGNTPSYPFTLFIFSVLTGKRYFSYFLHTMTIDQSTERIEKISILSFNLICIYCRLLFDILFQGVMADKNQDRLDCLEVKIGGVTIFLCSIEIIIKSYLMDRFLHLKCSPSLVENLIKSLYDKRRDVLCTLWRSKLSLLQHHVPMPWLKRLEILIVSLKTLK